MKSLLIPVALTIGVAAASPAAAETRSTTVDFTDLNLLSEKGRKTLERRLDRAAQTVCRYDRADIRARTRSPSAYRCYVKTKSEAQVRMASIIDDRSRRG